MEGLKVEMNTRCAIQFAETRERRKRRMEERRMASMPGLYIEERGEEISEEFNDACIFCYGIFVRNPRLESTRFCVPPLVQNSSFARDGFM
jgi:hypothetical protein